MVKVLLIDNYDSFVYNIAQYLGEMGADVTVMRNDVSLEEARKAEPDRIVLSPGPGHPRDSRVTLEILRTLSRKIPTLGVCLGHQAIAESLGGKIERAENLLHGKTSMVSHDSKGVFRGLPATITATRYHSLVIDEKSMPVCLHVTARADTGEIMGVRHNDYPIHGLQFHPESILTQDGKKMLRNFLEGSL